MESLELSSALHHALMNHCRKSETEIRFWKSLDKCPRRSDANASSIEFLSRSELSRKFDALGLAEQAIDRQYTCCVKDTYSIQLATEPGATPVTAVIVGFRDDQNRLRFLVHAFIRDDGTIAASGFCDPKLIYDEQWRCFKTR